MLPGTPEEARWLPSAGRRALSVEEVERLVHCAFPRSRVLEAHPLPGGLRNTNLKLRLDCAPHWVVLRVYEHDPSLCRKELDLMRLVAGSVPVPDILHAEPAGLDGSPPFALLQYVDGISFRELRSGGDREAIAQAAAAAGETLAAMGRFTFDKSGWLAPGPAVTAELLEGDDPLPRFVDVCLASANLQSRMPAELRERTHALAWACAARLAELDNETTLVHGDFNKRNLLVVEKAGRWTVAAVLDWEFAVSGTPLADIGNFLRYERASRPPAEPYFSGAYLRAGGSLPPDWRRVARVVDLTALCPILAQDELSEEVAAEVVELIRATVESREPRLE